MKEGKDFLEFSDEDIDMIIQEARLMAIKEVKEKLTQNFAKILWEDAENKIKGEVLKKGGFIENDQIIKNEPDIIPENKKIYLFGITGGDGEGYITQKSFKGMTDQDRVYTIRHQELIGVVCQVSEAEFNDLKIQELKENRDWLEEKIGRHKKVISLVAKNHPFIPMRFFVLYQDHDQVQLFLKENYNDLLSRLGQIRGNMEWGLKLFLDSDKFKKFLQEEDNCINSLMDEASLNQIGRGYFPQKKLAYRIESKAVDLAEEVHCRLYHFSKGAVLNKLILAKEHENGKQMILNGAYLVGKNHEEEFLQVVQWLEETEGEKGLIFKVSGPRPCYNFCHVSSNAT